MSWTPVSCTLQASIDPASVAAGKAFTLSLTIHMTDTRYVAASMGGMVFDKDTGIQVGGEGTPINFKANYAQFWDARRCVPNTGTIVLTMPAGRTTPWNLKVYAISGADTSKINNSVEVTVPLAVALEAATLKVVGLAAGATIGGVVGYAINPKKPLVPVLVGAVLGAGLGYGVGYVVAAKS